MRANEEVFGLQKIIDSDIQQFIRYYGIDDLTDYDETDFDDDGGTVKSPDHLMKHYDSSEEDDSPHNTVGELQIDTKQAFHYSNLIQGRNGGVPETIDEQQEDCTPTIQKTNLSFKEENQGNVSIARPTVHKKQSSSLSILVEERNVEKTLKNN